MKLDVTKVDEVVTNIARKYCRNTTIEYDDFYQDLWMKALKLDTDNMAILIKSLVNFSIDMSRSNWKQQSMEDKTVSTSQVGDYGEEYLYNHSRMMSHNTENIEGYIQSIDIIMKLPKRERTFAVAKAYLNGKMDEFADEYALILSEVPEERLDLLRAYDKEKYTDDIILKVFLGIRTGTNAASARTIKWNLVQAFQD